MKHYIYSALSGQVVYEIREVESGFQWKLLWRYDRTSQTFNSFRSCIENAKADYKKLREDTATLIIGRRSCHKVYHI